MTSGTGIGYNRRMANPHHHHEGCCAGCGRIAPIDDTELCVSCTENLNALIDDRDADNDAFAAACDSMTPEDWDADNDWLASAGWGEM